MARLLIPVGLSSSGKSTFIKQNTGDMYDIISTDTIREELCGNESDQSKNDEVFKLFHKRIGEGLKEGRNVCADATNINIKSRRPLIEIGKRYGAEIVCVLFVTPFESCIARDQLRVRTVGEKVIEKQLRRFEVPFYEEGFDHILITSSMPKSYHTLYDTRNFYMDKAHGFDQHNSHHKYDLETHSILVASDAYESLLDIEGLNAIFDGMLCHDIGKLYTQTFDDEGVAHYYNHENVGAYKWLSDMWHEKEKYYNKDLLKSAFVINYHMRPFGWTTDKAKQKALRTFGADWCRVLTAVHKADKEN